MGEVGGGTPVFHYMDAEGAHGDGSAEKNHNHDHSSESLLIRLAPPEPMVFVLTMVTVFVSAEGKMEPGEYGNLPRLNTGLVMGIWHGDTLLVDTTAGVPVRTNADWMKIGQAYKYLEPKKNKDRGYWISWWLASLAGDPVFLDGRLQHEFAIMLNDDFSGLEEHYFVVFGYHRPK